jgi:hypothetical protein
MARPLPPKCEPRLRVHPFEAAAVLQRPVSSIRKMIARGEFDDVGATSRSELDPDELISVAVDLARRGEISHLAPFLARQLAAGNLVVVRPSSDSAPPPSLLVLLDDFRAVHPIRGQSTLKLRA